jgi:hypothetical protein
MNEFGFDAFGGWDDEPSLCAGVVVRHWRSTVVKYSPWDAMPADDVLGNMRRVLSELLNDARDIDHQARRVRMLAAAHEHGVFRRAQRCSSEHIYCEFGLVLDALASVLYRGGVCGDLVQNALTILDPDVRLAEHAAMIGWNHMISSGRLDRQAPLSD